ncbi:MAG: hypothetical protein AB1641_23395 [Thermodesulfobacteriota bacterium]
MKQEGPLLEKLTHRLAECPADFLAEPRIGETGQVYVEAVVSDLLLDLGGEPLAEAEVPVFHITNKKMRNFLRLVSIAGWLLHDEWFRRAQRYNQPARAFLKTGLNQLADLVAADLFVTDPDRREELVRLVLNALELRPQGETPAQAADRLKTLGSVERIKVLEATRAAEERARKIREKMREQAAREAAAKASPE